MDQQLSAANDGFHKVQPRFVAASFALSKTIFSTPDAVLRILLRPMAAKNAGCPRDGAARHHHDRGGCVARSAAWPSTRCDVTRQRQNHQERIGLDNVFIELGRAGRRSRSAAVPLPSPEELWMRGVAFSQT
jgi:hypothetical protein